jgi:hypothetical protein
MRSLSRIAAVVVFATFALAGPSAAEASLIGQLLTHQCPQCGPPYSEAFVVVQGSPELQPFDQWEVDVEATTIRITWLIDAMIIPQIDFIFLGITSGLSSVTVDPSSTYIPTTLSFTQTSDRCLLSELRRGDGRTVPAAQRGPERTQFRTGDAGAARHCSRGVGIAAAAPSSLTEVAVKRGPPAGPFL